MQATAFYQAMRVKACHSRFHHSWTTRKAHNIIDTLAKLKAALLDIMYNDAQGTSGRIAAALAAYGHGAPRRLAYASVLHSRLGSGAPAAILSDCVTEAIANDGAPHTEWPFDLV
jgi:hypothetical protein